MKNINFRDRSGDLMIESLVSISIVLIGMLGIFGLLSQSIALNKSVSQKFVATYLAAEGIEVVRSLVDANYAQRQPGKDIPAWNQGLPDGTYAVTYDMTNINSGSGDLTTPLGFNLTTGIYDYKGKEITPFVRTVQITNSPDGTEMTVLAVVSWTDQSGAKSVSLEDHFFDWRP